MAAVGAAIPPQLHQVVREQQDKEIMVVRANSPAQAVVVGVAQARLAQTLQAIRQQAVLAVLVRRHHCQERLLLMLVAAEAGVIRRVGQAVLVVVAQAQEEIPLVLLWRALQIQAVAVGEQEDMKPQLPVVMAAQASSLFATLAHNEVRVEPLHLRADTQSIRSQLLGRLQHESLCKSQRRRGRAGHCCRT